MAAVIRRAFRSRVLPALAGLLCLLQAAVAEQQACRVDKNSWICGEGRDALRLFEGTSAPSGKFAFAWRSPNGIPSGDEIPVAAENLLVRSADGVILAKLGGEYWATGQMRANRYESVASWSPDSRAVIEVANDRWDTASLRYYALSGDDKAEPFDLYPLVEPALKAKLPPRKRENYTFRVREDQPIKLDVRGHLRFFAMLYLIKSDQPSLDYELRVDITRKEGKMAAKVVSIRRVTLPP
jgi:hypothetical protein